MGMDNCRGTKHGTASASANYGCKCPDAVELRRAQKRAHDQRRKQGELMRVDATPTMRRLWALSALGHSNKAIAKAAEMNEEMVRRIMAGTFVRVAPQTALRASVAFEQLSMVPGVAPKTWQAQKRSKAAASPPPLAWDEGAIDDPRALPVMTGRETMTSKYAGASSRRPRSAETYYEYGVIRDSGMSHEFALAELGISQEAYALVLRRLGLTAPVARTEPTPTRRAANGSLSQLRIT